MGLYKQQGSTYWLYRFTLNGQRVHGSTKQTDRKLAQKIFDHERAQYVLGEKTNELRPVKLKDLINEYLAYSKANKRSYKDDLSLSNRVLTYFGDCMASAVTQQEVERYKAVRREKVSVATINREVTFLKGVFTKSVAWKKVKTNPVKGVALYNEKDRARERYLKVDEQARLLGVCPPRLRQIVLFALRTGARQSEILGLRWLDIDFTTGLIAFRKTKTGKMRYTPLHGDLVEMFSQMPRTGEFVFPGPAGGLIGWDSSLRNAWEKALATAGITDFKFHDLRHTTASMLAMRGASLQAIAAILGHSGTRMTERYAHLSPQHVAATLALLPPLPTGNKVVRQVVAPDNSGKVAV